MEDYKGYFNAKKFEELRACSIINEGFHMAFPQKFAEQVRFLVEVSGISERYIIAYYQRAVMFGECGEWFVNFVENFVMEDYFVIEENLDQLKKFRKWYMSIPEMVYV